MTKKKLMKVSIVASIYNEEKGIRYFYNELKKVINAINSYEFEILLIDDGSIDNSVTILKEIVQNESNSKIISFSKNFGHEAAMIAGIDAATGDYIICMDSDLQHPPKKINDIIASIENGYEIINMVRESNKDEKLWKRASSYLFYRLINKISHVTFEPSASDFFMISKKVADIFRNNYREKIRFLRGYIQMIGFKRCTIKFHADERYSGNSKYSAMSLTRFAIGVIFTFSNLPLRLGLYTSLVSFLLGVAISVYTIVLKLTGTYSPDGYSTIVVLISFFFSVLFLIIGIIGEYLRMIFEESKERPIYIIASTYQSKEKNKQ